MQTSFLTNMNKTYDLQIQLYSKNQPFEKNAKIKQQISKPKMHSRKSDFRKKQKESKYEKQKKCNRKCKEQVAFLLLFFPKKMQKKKRKTMFLLFVCLFFFCFFFCFFQLLFLCICFFVCFFFAFPIPFFFFAYVRRPSFTFAFSIAFFLLCSFLFFKLIFFRIILNGGHKTKPSSWNPSPKRPKSDFHVRIRESTSFPSLRPEENTWHYLRCCILISASIVHLCVRGLRHL